MAYTKDAKNDLFNQYLMTIPSKKELPSEFKQWLSDVETRLHSAHSLLYCLCAAGDVAGEGGSGPSTVWLPQEMPAALRVVERILYEILAEVMQ